MSVMSTTVSVNSRGTFSALAMVLNYARIELVRQFRQVSTLVFIVGLPLLLFLIFGAMQNYSTMELPNGRGNVAASIMVSMAAYGAIVATSALSGSAAVEFQQGWGRQLGVTPFRGKHFLAAKTFVALILAVLPIVVIFITGSLTSARLEGWIWLGCGVLTLVPGITFAFYGLAVGTLLRSEAAVNAASGLVVVFMFLGNAFAPLSGFLFDLSPFTPVWGVMQLAVWLLQEGNVYNGLGQTVQFELWQAVLNCVAWTLIFGALAALGARGGKQRR